MHATNPDDDDVTMLLTQMGTGGRFERRDDWQRGGWIRESRSACGCRCQRRHYEDVEDDAEDIDDIEGKQERRRKEEGRQRGGNDDVFTTTTTTTTVVVYVVKKRTDDDDGRALLFRRQRRRRSIEQEGREDFEAQSAMEGEGGRGEEEEEDDEEDEKRRRERATRKKKKKKKRKTSQMRGCSTIYTAFTQRRSKAWIYVADADSEKVLHPAIKGRMDIVGAAETGSRKTMAFGLPILQRLMQDKEEEKWYEDYPDEEKPGKERNTCER